MKKRFFATLLAAALIAGALPMTASAYNPYADLLDGPPELFTAEAVLAAYDPEIGGEFGLYNQNLIYHHIGEYFVGELTYGESIDYVVQGDGFEFSGYAKSVLSDGTVINGVVEYFSDGERISFVFPQEKVGKGLRFAVVVLVKVAQGEEESHVTICFNRGVYRTYSWEAGDVSFTNSPYKPTPRTASGPIEDIFYEEGDITRVKPNANLPGNEPAEQPSSWAAASVNAAIAGGLVPSVLQSKYTQPTTRVEYCALAVALYEKHSGEITERAKFSDTIDVNVEKMAALGVVNGVGDNKFDPDAKLTREQAAVMLSRLADALGKPLAAKDATFADNAKISSWAIEGVGQVQAAGIMSGVGDNTFAPKEPYTREQSIITMLRLWDAVK
jgi:hypothetical protein